MENNLKIVAAYTDNRRFIGKVNSEVLKSLTNGFVTEGIMLNQLQNLHKRIYFFGKPKWKGVLVKDYRDTQPHENDLGTEYSSVAIPVDSILFIHDFEKKKEKNIHSLEVRSIEQRAELCDVKVMFDGFEGCLRGKTFLNKSALKNGIVHLETRFPNWFILQKPELSHPECEHIVDYFEIIKLEHDIGEMISAMIINGEKATVLVV